MNLRVLLVESEPEDMLFVQDVLAEIESGHYWTNWVHIDTLHAATWEETAAILGNEPIDIILLGLVLPLRNVQAIISQLPVVLLVSPEDEGLAIRMLREGAQDFLIKEQVDCAPLAHAMRNAIERHRFLAAARAGSVTDSLTGLPNRGGFLAFADRDRRLAERLGRRLMVVVAEPRSIVEITGNDSEQHRDLMLVEAADYLRRISGPTDLLARIEPTRFALTVFDSEAESVEESWARMHSASAALDLHIGAAIFDPEHPGPLEGLLEQATDDLAPRALSHATIAV